MIAAPDKNGKRLLVGQRVKYAQAEITYQVIYITGVNTAEQHGRWVLIKANAHPWPITVPSYLLEIINEPTRN
ncbi:MAG: hypothetical protein ACRC62_02155 [Microcoleus sp.]